MIPYSQKHTDQFECKQYKKYLSNRAYASLKRCSKDYSPSTLQSFYDCSNDKEDKLKSPRQAIERSFTLAIRIICEALALIYFKKGLKRSDRRSLISLLTSSVSPMSKRASDTEFRIQLTYSFIRHLFRLRKSTRKDKSLEFYLLTFTCDSWCSSEYNPVVDLYKAKEDVSALLRRYGECNAVGVFEIQPLLNDPLAKGAGMTLMLHCHVVVWRERWAKAEFVKFRNKVEARLENKRLKSPVHRERIKCKKNDILRTASYLPKLPGYAKRWDCKTKLVNSEKRLSRKRILRHLEILSYIPQKSLIFAVGDGGRSLKSDIWDEVSVWNKTRVKAGTELRLSHKALRKLWTRVWDVIYPKYSNSPEVFVQRGDKSHAR